MTIRKPVKTPKPAAMPAEAAAAFIAGAPDAGARPSPEAVKVVVTPKMLADLPKNKRGNKLVTTIGLVPDTVAHVDAAAAALGLTRTAWITMVITQALAK